MAADIARMPVVSSVATATADRIRRFIGEHRLRTGDRLPSERDLAVRLGTSRTSIRAALLYLQTEGLVEVRPKSGSFVATSDGRHILQALHGWLKTQNLAVHELVEFRRSLEPAAAAAAAARRTNDDLEWLRSRLKHMAQAVDDGDPATYADHDSAFHEGVASASQNPLFLLMTQTLHEVLHAYRRATANLGGQTLERSYRDHAAIYEAIARGDQFSAYDAMVHHIVDGVVDVDVLEPLPSGDLDPTFGGSAQRDAESRHTIEAADGA